MLKRVKKSKQPLTVTLRGVPLVNIIPVLEDDSRPPKELGALKGRITIKGDIVDFDSVAEWDALECRQKVVRLSGGDDG